MQDDAGDVDSSDEDGPSDFRASKWLRARPRAVPEDALILAPAAALTAAFAAYEADTVAFTSAQAWEKYARKVPGMSDRGFKQAYNTKVRRSKLASTAQSASTPGTGPGSGNGERHFDTAAKAKAMAQTDKLHQTDTLGLLHGTPKPFKWAPPPYKAGESPEKYKNLSNEPLQELAGPCANSVLGEWRGVLCVVAAKGGGRPQLPRFPPQCLHRRPAPSFSYGAGGGRRLRR